MYIHSRQRLHVPASAAREGVRGGDRGVEVGGVAGDDRAERSARVRGNRNDVHGEDQRRRPRAEAVLLVAEGQAKGGGGCGTSTMTSL